MREKYRLCEAQQLRLISIVGVGYAGVMSITVWQALRGQPLIAPDALTLGVTAGLLLMLAVATMMTLSRKV